MKVIKDVTGDFFKKLKKLKIFSLFTDQELEKVKEYIDYVEYEMDEVIVVDEEISPYMYSIIDGTVRVTVKQVMDDFSTKDVYICTIGRGETFGEAAVFMNVKRTANVISNDYTVLVRFKREKLLEFIKKYPASGIKILMVIIYSLLNKLKEVNRELAFERKTVLEQEDIDNLVQQLLDGNKIN